MRGGKSEWPSLLFKNGVDQPVILLNILSEESGLKGALKADMGL